MLNNKKTVYVFVILVLLLLLFWIFSKPKAENTIEGNKIITDSTTEKKSDTTAETTDTTDTNVGTTLDKIIPGDNLCAQITKEFITKATSVPIARVDSVNDTSITACNYYLTNDKNSPYVAVILNKNLSIEVQKAFYTKKLDLITDPRIVTNHIIYKDLKEDRIAHIDLVLDPMNFIRVSRNVERAISNESLVILSTAISKRL